MVPSAIPAREFGAPGAAIGAPISLEDAVRDGCGEFEGDADPRRANRAARSSVGLGPPEGVTEVL
jgi:hypothetical protein